MCHLWVDYNTWRKMDANGENQMSTRCRPYSAGKPVGESGWLARFDEAMHAST